MDERGSLLVAALALTILAMLAFAFQGEALALPLFAAGLACWGAVFLPASWRGRALARLARFRARTPPLVRRQGGALLLTLSFALLASASAALYLNRLGTGGKASLVVAGVIALLAGTGWPHASPARRQADPAASLNAPRRAA